MTEFGWTDNFAEFRQKVESLFGPIVELEKRAPDVYAHQVLAHGFLEYALVRGLFDNAQLRIKEDNGYFDHSNPEHENLYWQCLKREYVKWARQHELPQGLLEAGWEEFIND